MKRPHTLRSISDEVGRDKRTVQTWYAAERQERGEFGVITEGTRRFSDEEREWLIKDRCEVVGQTYEMKDVTVETGNHSIVLSDPKMPQTYTLESLRSTEVVSFEDPLAIADQFLKAADQLQEVMQADIKAREQRLQQTRQAKEAVSAKKQKLELETRLYQLQTSQIDSAQTQETQGLQTALSALQQLGKPE